MARVNAASPPTRRPSHGQAKISLDRLMPVARTGSAGGPKPGKAHIPHTTLLRLALCMCSALHRLYAIPRSPRYTLSSFLSLSRSIITSGNSDLVGDQKKTEKPVIGVSKPARKPAADMAGDHGNITIINKSAEWDAKLEEAKSTGKIVVVDFTATWCGPCRLMAPIFTELSKKFLNLIFLKVDVDEVQDVTAKWEVRAMPTFIFIQNGKQIDKIIGANRDELEKKVAHFANLNVTASA